MIAVGNNAATTVGRVADIPHAEMNCAAELIVAVNDAVGLDVVAGRYCSLAAELVVQAVADRFEPELDYSVQLEDTVVPAFGIVEAGTIAEAAADIDEAALEYFVTDTDRPVDSAAAEKSIDWAADTEPADTAESVDTAVAADTAEPADTVAVVDTAAAVGIAAMADTAEMAGTGEIADTAESGGAVEAAGIVEPVDTAAGAVAAIGKS